MPACCRRMTASMSGPIRVLPSSRPMGVFIASCLTRAVTPPFRWFPILKQIHFIGARSTIVILVAGLFTGMVVALQFYDSLVRFGAVAMLGAAVALGLIRELAPVLTALVIIGRVGSAICAEIGIMRSDEQIDALSARRSIPNGTSSYPSWWPA